MTTATAPPREKPRTAWQILREMLENALAWGVVLLALAIAILA